MSLLPFRALLLLSSLSLLLHSCGRAQPSPLHLCWQDSPSCVPSLCAIRASRQRRRGALLSRFLCHVCPDLPSVPGAPSSWCSLTSFFARPLSLVALCSVFSFWPRSQMRRSFAVRSHPATSQSSVFLRYLCESQLPGQPGDDMRTSFVGGATRTATQTGVGCLESNKRRAQWQLMYAVCCKAHLEHI